MMAKGAFPVFLAGKSQLLSGVVTLAGTNLSFWE